MKDKPRQARAVFITRRRKSGKYEWYFTVTEYKGATWDIKLKKFNYPEFKKTFPTYKAAKECGLQKITEIQKRFKNIHFEGRFLYDPIY
jgi:hypothetical protein